MRIRLLYVTLLLTGLFFAGCQDHRDITPSTPFSVQDFATGLAVPLGMTIDPAGNIWVTEVAAGKVSVMTPDGKAYTAITGFSVAVSPEGLPDGLNHLLYRDGLLYILHGVDDKLYIADVRNFRPGNTPLTVGQLQSEAIGQFVLNYKFAEDTDESNLYNLTFGPNGDLYITDAAANAVIRRTSTGALSVFTTLPSYANPTPVGPPMVQAVPTGIVFDGQKFLVSTLTGFPFIVGRARVFQVDLSGNASVYQDGLTSLVDIILGAGQRPLVLTVAEFGAQGPTPKTGKLTQIMNGQATTVLSGLNLPTSIIAGNQSNTYFINSLADGKIQRITY